MKTFSMIIGLLMLSGITIKGTERLLGTIVLSVWILVAGFLITFPLYLEFMQ